MTEQERQHESDGSGTALAPERPRVGPPRQYKVVLLNDDFTPMEFVVEILVGVFVLPPAKAVEVMLAVHQQGSGVAGVYTRDIAETKIVMAHELAAREQHPLRCTMEQA